MTISKAFTTIVAFALLFAAVSTSSGFEHQCDACGCRKVKKVTRLTKVCKQFEMPVYECIDKEAYFPKKAIVAHNYARCDDNYRIHTCGRLCEDWVKHEEACEETTHVVKLGNCCSSCECETSVHHREYYDYEVEFQNKVSLTCCPTQSCKELYGACPNGCFEVIPVKHATEQFAQCSMPEVRWVTFIVCSKCSHAWEDAVHGATVSHAAVSKAGMSTEDTPVRSGDSSEFMIRTASLSAEERSSRTKRISVPSSERVSQPDIR